MADAEWSDIKRVAHAWPHSPGKSRIGYSLNWTIRRPRGAEPATGWVVGWAEWSETIDFDPRGSMMGFAPLYPSYGRCMTRSVLPIRATGSTAKPVNPVRQKIFRFIRKCNSVYKPVRLAYRGALRDRHERGVRCGGRRACNRRVRATRTAKIIKGLTP